MVSSSRTAARRPEARIIIDATGPSFVRLSIFEVEDDKICGSVNPDFLMDGLLEKHFSDDRRLYRQRSGGLYLAGNTSRGREDLKALLVSKGYRTISIKEPGKPVSKPHTY